MSKPRIVKDYEKLPEEVIANLKAEYPYGFAQHLISYTNMQGKRISALPFETDEIYYLIKMSEQEAVKIIEDDEDYDDEGKLRDDYEVSEFEDEADTTIIVDDASETDVKDESHNYDDDDFDDDEDDVEVEDDDDDDRL